MRRILLLLLILSSIGFCQTVTTGNITTSGATCTPTTSCVSMTLPSNAGYVTVQLTGTFAATVQFEESADNITWVSASATPIPTSTAVSSTTTVGNWVLRSGGYGYVRLRASAYTSGTAAVTINAQTSVLVNNSTNVCGSTANLKKSSGVTSGTTAVQIISSVVGQTVYVCSLSASTNSGSSITFSLVQGTGTNCGTGQTSLVTSFPMSQNDSYAFSNPYSTTVAAPYLYYATGVPVWTSTSGNAVCYLIGGVTPAVNYTVTYVQQ